MKNEISVGILGMGKMGEALALGLKKSLSDVVIQASTRTQASAHEVQSRLGIECHTDNKKVAQSSNILILCVKPHQAKQVLKQISPVLKKNQILISIAASLTTDDIQKGVRSRCAVVRAMPNTPCLIGQGMTVLCAGVGVKPAQIAVAQKIFESVGRTQVLEEALMDGVTGLSGCGPAYVYLIIEALSEAGVKVGLPRQTATLLAAQTLKGAAQMVLERGDHPAALKDEVTTPAGCTIDGLMALEEGKLRVTLIKAVLAAKSRSETLRKG